MKPKNRYPWLKGRRISITELNPHELHDDTDTKKLHRLAKRIERSILRRLAGPIEVSSTTYSEVQFLRTIFADTELGPLPRFAGFMVRELKVNGDGSIQSKLDPYPDIHCLDRALDFKYFSERLVASWELAIPTVLINVPEDHRDWASWQTQQWLSHRVYRLLKRTLKPAMINRNFLHAMHLDGRALEIARHLPSIGRNRHTYETALANHEWLSRIQADDSNLIWLGLIFADGIQLDAELEPVAGIRKWFIDHGLTLQGWRMLKNSSYGYWMLLGMWTHQESDERLSETVIPWVEAHIRNGLRRLVPIDLAVQIVQDVIPYSSEADRKEGVVRLPDAMFRLLAKAAIQADKEGCLEEWMSNDWLRFRRWFEDHPRFMPDSNQLKAGWPWLAKRIDQWLDAVERGDVKSKLRWEFAVDRFEDESIEAVGLPTSKALWEEGQHMHHCLGENGAQAGTEGIRYFSIRQKSDQRRLATLEIAFAANDSVWRAVQCNGRLNSYPPESVIKFADRLAREYSVADAERMKNQLGKAA